MESMAHSHVERIKAARQRNKYKPSKCPSCSAYCLTWESCPSRIFCGALFVDCQHPFSCRRPASPRFSFNQVHGPLPSFRAGACSHASLGSMIWNVPFKGTTNPDTTTTTTNNQHQTTNITFWGYHIPGHRHLSTLTMQHKCTAWCPLDHQWSPWVLTFGPYSNDGSSLVELSKPRAATSGSNGSDDVDPVIPRLVGYLRPWPSGSLSPGYPKSLPLQRNCPRYFLETIP